MIKIIEVTDIRVVSVSDLNKNSFDKGEDPMSLLTLIFYFIVEPRFHSQPVFIRIDSTGLYTV